MTNNLLFATLTLLALPAICAQSQLEFEVASIKPGPSLDDLVRSRGKHLGAKIDGALADFGAMALDELIQYAFHVKPFQISGAGDSTARFDILAKLPYGATPAEVPGMMQRLLAERFHLALHWGTKEIRSYALVVNPKGGKLTQRPADYDRAADRALPLDRQVSPITLDRLAEYLTPYFDRPVVNQTGMQEEFMVPLGQIARAWPTRWSDRNAATHGIQQAASLPDISRILAILAERGLKLESRKVPFPILTIDRLEKTPAEQ